MTRARVLQIDTPPRFDAAIAEARELLIRGEVVVVPTETVYGLAANALDERAVARIFETKGRPSHNPIIVHVANLELAKRCAASWPSTAGALAAAFWPGPLTIVLPKAAAVPSIVTAGGDTVAIRWPSHPFIRRLIEACGFPLAAPSANLSGEISPTNAQHALKTLGARVPLIIDGGQAQVGIESTVLDLTVSPPGLLRPGLIHIESLAAVVGRIEGPGAAAADASLKSPGLLTKHYSPKARLIVLAWETEADLSEKAASAGIELSKCHIIAHSHIPMRPAYGAVAVIPHDAEAYARALYGELHRADEEGAPVIVAEAVPDTPAWQGIADRLRRASAG